MMRLAFISDIHGNPIALEAVLADIQAKGGVDGYWLLGDYCALGYDPARVLEIITALPNAVYVRGNTDRYTITGERPRPTVEGVFAEPELMPKFIEVIRSFAWTQGSLTAGDWEYWLEKLPIEQRITLPDGTRLLGVHASPGSDDGDGFMPSNVDDYEALLAGCKDDLVMVGHTHWPLDVRVGNIRIVNIGSISNPCQPDLRACYVLLTADKAGYQIQFNRVAYDHESVIKAIRHSRHPSQDFIIHFQKGEWVRDWDDKLIG